MPKLAIVGAGVSGCSAAYYARKYLPGTDVTIYDTKKRIGGRILTCHVGGTSQELGAAFFNGFNRTLLGIVETERVTVRAIGEYHDFGVWNGSELIFRSSNRSFLTTARLLAKYRLDVARAFRLLREAKRQIANLYAVLKNPAELSQAFESTGLDKWYSKTLLGVLIERGFSQAFIDEIVTPITRAIYSQNAELGGFAGISSLIGVNSGEAFRLVEGNATLPVHLAKTSNSTIKLCQKIDTIEKLSSGAYRLLAGKEAAVFDSVILATPLERAGIRFDGISVEVTPPQPYQTVHTRIIRGVFNPRHFGLKKSAAPQTIVLTTENSGHVTQYSIQEIGNGESLVTVSSPKPLESDSFKGVFKDGGFTILDHCWKAAYPIFKPISRLPPTRLDKRLIYSCAIESAVASMETSMLSALNAVQMLNKE